MNYMNNITKSWNDTQIRIREDRYVSLTDMAKATGKRLNDWVRLESSKSYLEELSSVVGITTSDLLQIQKGLKQGGTPQDQGTWGHPMVAIEFGRWLSPEFGIWCNIHLHSIGFTDNNFYANKTKLKSGFVYLAMTHNGWCKIGMSKQPYRRMSSLQTGTPLEVKLIHRVFTFDMVELEKALHEYYAAYWMRGEWFDLPDECIREFPTIANTLDAKLEQVCLPEQK